MKCPFCDNADTRVIDSRPTDEGQVIRRRRACDSCKKRFTTYEKVEEIMFMVVKKDGSRELFNRSKVRNGIVNACKKRPITTEQIEKIVDDIERGLNNMMEKERSSAKSFWTISKNWMRWLMSDLPRSTGSLKTWILL